MVISGPSGVGKGTLIAEIRDRVPEIFYSISATTRPPRPGEVDGKDYYFLSREEFEREIKNGGFLEWADIYGDLYGTPVKPIEKALAAGKLVILEIDVQGAMQVQDKLGRQAAYIFIMPPSIEALAQRLEARRSESLEDRRKRLCVAEKEVKFADHYDFVIINDQKDRAAEELSRVLQSCRCKEG